MLSAEKLGPLADLMKPDSITVYGSELYIVEGASILVYSIKDLKLERRFGKKGQGPGELSVGPGYVNKITVFKDRIIAECQTKLIYFSKQGKFIKEIKKNSVRIMQSIPVGNNFAVSKLKPGKNGKAIYDCVCLFNSEMKEIKELYRMKFMQQGQPPGAKLNMLFDHPGFSVTDNKIFVERSEEGFLIDVFDENGNRLYQIQREFKKVKIPDQYRENVIKQLKNDSLVKAMGGWESFKKLFKFHFPDTFPAIKDIEVSKNRIFVHTHNEQGNTGECIILNHKGDFIKRVFLPRFKNTSLIGSILGARVHAIQDDALYYILENWDTEEWELYRVRID
jgi:hypothetical protein